MDHFCCLLLPGLGLLSSLGRLFRLFSGSNGRSALSQVDTLIVCTEMADVSRFLRAKILLGAQIIFQVCVNRNQPIHHKDPRRSEVSPVGLRSLRPSLKGFLLGHRRS